jgi:rhamnogalacturonyl hydrolase YesR
MGTAVYARIGAITGDSKYFAKAWANFNLSAFTPHPTGYAFWSPSEQLFYRDPPKGSPNGVFWARGSGWVAAALADVLRLSRPDDAAVPQYAGVFKQFMARLATLQGADGCWRTSLTDPGAAAAAISKHRSMPDRVRDH